MREGWKYDVLSELVTVINGLWKGKKEPFINVGVIRNANFNKDITLNYSNIEYLDVEERQYKTRKLLSGDLIVEKSGGSEKQPVGRTVLFRGEGEFSVSNFTSILRIKDQNVIIPEFLYKYLLFVYYSGVTKAMQKATTGIHNILFDKFLAIQIPIPSIVEQERIVSLLDLEFAKIDAIKANAEKQLQDAKDLFQSALKDLLTPKEGWKSSKFGDVCEYYKEQGKWVNINYIGLENIDAHTGRLIDYKSSNEVESSTFKFNKGDVLYGRLRPYLQKVIIAPFDGCCSTEIFPIKSNAINNVYLKFWLLSDAVMDIMNESCSGCRMPRANMNSFKEEYIQYPSEQEQIIIANKLVDLQNKIGEIQFNYEQTIILCNDLKQSILKDIFG